MSSLFHDSCYKFINVTLLTCFIAGGGASFWTHWCISVGFVESFLQMCCQTLILWCHIILHDSCRFGSGPLNESRLLQLQKALKVSLQVCDFNPLPILLHDFPSFCQFYYAQTFTAARSGSADHRAKWSKFVSKFFLGVLRLAERVRCPVSRVDGMLWVLQSISLAITAELWPAVTNNLLRCSILGKCSFEFENCEYSFGWYAVFLRCLSGRLGGWTEELLRVMLFSVPDTTTLY